MTPVIDDRFGDNRLKPFADSLWTATTPIRFAGTWFPHVMTVIRLRDGSVMLHSPCRPSAALFDEIAEIGAVAHVVAPNWFHDLYLHEYRAAYPGAAFWAPALLGWQHPGLIDEVLGAANSTSWAAELPHVALSGLLSFDEAIFFHVPSRTLIVADFLMDAVADEKTPAFTRIGYRLFGLNGRLKVFPLLRWFGVSSRPSMQRAAEQIIAWDPRRVIVGHGYPIINSVSDELRAALSWLPLKDATAAAQTS